MANVSEVQVVLCIDSSGSMSTGNYIQGAINDSNTFVNIMLPDDAIGVVTFNDTARYVYDNGANPPKVQVIQGTVLQEASKAISALKANGLTNMQQGLDYSVNLINLSDRTRNPAILLLSDGYANRGTTPPNPPAHCPRLYTIALGPYSDQNLLKDLANKTGGNYHLSPDVFDLASIYFNIALETGTVTRLVTNDIVGFNTAKAANLAALTAPTGIQTKRNAGLIPAETREIRLAVTWVENTRYVTGTPTANNEFSLKVYQNGKALTLPTPDDRGNYLVFKLKTPEAGLYTVETSYLGTQSFQPTVAMLDYGTDPAAKMVVDLDRDAKVGQPVVLSASMNRADGQALSDVTFTGSISAPAVAATEAYQTTDAELACFYASDGEASADLSQDRAESLSKRIAAYGPLPKIRHDFTALPDQGGSPRSQYSFIPHLPGVYVVRLQADYRGGAPETHFTQSTLVTLKVT
jgi:hypothetical protein